MPNRAAGSCRETRVDYFYSLGHATGKRSTLRVLPSPYVHPCTENPPQVCTVVVVALSCDAYQVQYVPDTKQQFAKSNVLGESGTTTVLQAV